MDKKLLNLGAQFVHDVPADPALQPNYCAARIALLGQGNGFAQVSQFGIHQAGQHIQARVWLLHEVVQ